MVFPNHKTKIVCTIGPASRSPETLEKMIQNGMNVARINFAHGDFNEHREVIADIRAASAKVGRRVAVLADLAGPKMRIGKIANEPVELEKGKPFILTTEETIGDENRVSVSFSNLHKVLKTGDKVFLSDGFILVKVESVEGREVFCQVMAGGTLRSHKGLNFPEADLGISAFTPRDHECLKFALEHGVDAVSQSFVQGPEDIMEVREAAKAMGHDVFIIAKIERSRALTNIEPILRATDGIMVARGDLGVEIPIEEIGVVQKQLIHQANIMGKPVITATQMLESMVENSRPTRAEVTDVTNAILDGTDCIMMSEETAMGAYPVESVAMMAAIAQATESQRSHQPVSEALKASARTAETRAEDLIALSVKTTTERLAPAAIITPSVSGATPRNITRFRLPTWIAVISINESTCQRLQFSYGVTADHVEREPDDWTTYARNWLNQHEITDGLAILTQGPYPSHPGGTNRMEILTL